jgi:hypothetical protein
MGEIIMMPKNGTERYFDKMGIRTIRDLQQHVQRIFEESDHQESVLVNLYKMLFPDWEKIQRIEGYPEVGQGLWNYICNLFIEFDRKNHPEYFKGGLWVNNGFASNDRLAPWMISLENCRVIYA